MGTVIPHLMSPSAGAEPILVSARPTDGSAYPLDALHKGSSDVSSPAGKELKVESSTTGQGQELSGGGNADETLLSYGLVMNAGQQVDWASGNAHHPRNWPASRKVFDTSIVIFLDFFTCVLSSQIPTQASSLTCGPVVDLQSVQLE